MYEIKFSLVLEGNQIAGRDRRIVQVSGNTCI